MKNLLNKKRLVYSIDINRMNADEGYDAYKKPYHSYKLKPSYTFSRDTELTFLIIPLDDIIYEVVALDGRNPLKAWCVYLKAEICKPNVLTEALTNGSRGHHMLQSKVFIDKEDGSLQIKVNNKISEVISTINMAVVHGDKALSYSLIYLDCRLDKNTRGYHSY